jgi:Peptidase M15
MPGALELGAEWETGGQLTLVRDLISRVTAIFAHIRVGRESSSTYSKGANMTTYFDPSETTCRCGCGFDITDEARDNFDKVRKLFGAPLSVSGPARCRKYNDSNGFAPRSRHVAGDALDISTAGWTQFDIHRLVICAVETGAGGIGIHSKFIHIDFRKGNDRVAVWKY